MPFNTARTAEELIAVYGGEAQTIAAGQADTMLELDDIEAFEAWNSVVAAIRTRPNHAFQAAE